jgi:hypothetical protein
VQSCEEGARLAEFHRLKGGSVLTPLLFSDTEAHNRRDPPTNPVLNIIFLLNSKALGQTSWFLQKAETCLRYVSSLCNKWLPVLCMSPLAAEL